MYLDWDWCTILNLLHMSVGMSLLCYIRELRSRRRLTTVSLKVIM